MTESYQKLREEFKQMDLANRVAFLAEASVLTVQSGIVGTLNLIGDVVEGASNVVGAVAQNFGVAGGTASDAASQTVNRVVITVKDATKAAGTVVKDVAKSVDAVTIDVAKTVGDVATKATEVTANVVESVQKTVSQATKKEEPKDDKPKGDKPKT